MARIAEPVVVRGRPDQSKVRMRLFHDVMLNKHRPSPGVCHIVCSEAVDVCRAVGMIPDIGPMQSNKKEGLVSDRQTLRLLILIGDMYYAVKSHNIAAEAFAEKFVPMLWELLHEDADERLDTLKYKGLSDEQISAVGRAVARFKKFCDQIQEQFLASET